MNQCASDYPSCACELVPTRCTFGPDSRGDIVTDVVVPEKTAESCEREFCTCTSHDNYEEVLASRLNPTEDEEIIQEDFSTYNPTITEEDNTSN